MARLVAMKHKMNEFLGCMCYFRARTHFDMSPLISAEPKAFDAWFRMMIIDDGYDDMICLAWHWKSWEQLV